MRIKLCFITIAITLIAAVVCTGCGNNTSKTSMEEIKFSNMVAPAVQEELAEIMTDAGISAERQDVFFEHVNDFNSIVSQDSLAVEYEQAAIKDTKYDPYEMQEEWTEKSLDFMGYNCRITAFGLYGDYMTIPADSEIRDDMILIDKVPLEEDSSVLLDEDDLAQFSVLYSTIPTVNTKDVDVHVENMKKDWTKRGIEFIDNDKARLISVVFHESMSEEENYLFIGHVGVLFDTGEKMYFVEKLAFQEPYQLTEFESRKQLSHYLMTKYDVDDGQPTARPFVMENDEIMTE